MTVLETELYMTLTVEHNIDRASSRVDWKKLRRTSSLSRVRGAEEKNDRGMDDKETDIK